MSSEPSGDARLRRRLIAAIRASLREAITHLSLLNHQVGGKVELKGNDIECLDLIGRHGPLSPGDLGRRTGLHPATLTGILDRLERGGWITREPSPADRRSVQLRALPTRGAELLGLYAPMNSTMDGIFARYTKEQLETIEDFIRRTATAARSHTADPPPPT
jgi:DNA-binding MarR family transcriptional regulator